MQLKLLSQGALFVKFQHKFFAICILPTVVCASTLLYSIIRTSYLHSQPAPVSRSVLVRIEHLTTRLGQMQGSLGRYAVFLNPAISNNVESQMYNAKADAQQVMVLPEVKRSPVLQELVHWYLRCVSELGHIVIARQGTIQSRTVMEQVKQRLEITEKVMNERLLHIAETADAEAERRSVSSTNQILWIGLALTGLCTCLMLWRWRVEPK